MGNYHLRHYPDIIGETVGSINNFSCFVVIESNCRTDTFVGLVVLLVVVIMLGDTLFNSLC